MSRYACTLAYTQLVVMLISFVVHAFMLPVCDQFSMSQGLEFRLVLSTDHMLVGISDVYPVLHFIVLSKMHLVSCRSYRIFGTTVDLRHV